MALPDLKLDRVINAVAILACLAAFGFTISGTLDPTASITVPGSELTATDPNEPALSGTGFAPNAVFSFIAPPPHISGVPLYGSAVAGDATTGTVRTRWYHPTRKFYLLVCGYPVNKGAGIFLEVYSPSSGIREVQIPFDENPESWRLQRISMAAYTDITKFRVVAFDHAQQTMGWIGFSPPFSLTRRVTTGLSSVLKQLSLLVLCAACCIVLVLGTGIVARSFLAQWTSAIWLPIPGILVLVFIGLGAWIGPAFFTPQQICRYSLAVLVMAIGGLLIKRPLTTLVSRVELKVLGFMVLFVAIAIAKGSYSIGPSGELYKGQISRTLEVGSRGDSRIPYHVVQMIGLRMRPYSPSAERFFAPWNFADRGPVASLAASAIVLCSNVKLPATPPDDTWTLFDPQGFAAYRVAVIVLTAGSLFVVFGLAKFFLDDNWAILAFLCAAAAPFTIHEIFFTWPKILTADFVLLGAYAVLRRRFFVGGLAVGLGYLFHPSALLFFPAVLAITLVGVDAKSPSNRAKLLEHIRFGLVTCAGLAVWIVCWRWLNRWHFHQNGFLSYFKGTYPFPYSVTNWFRSRLVDAAMTLVPLYTFLFHRLDREALPPDGLPTPWVQFIHQYWATLPFGAGVAFFPSLLRMVAVGFTKAKAWTWLVIMQPFLFFLAFWGVANTGLMREGLQTWFLGLILFAVVMWRRHLSNSKRLWMLVMIALAVRGAELLLMLIPFSAWSRGYVLQTPFVVSDFCCLFVIVAATGLLTVQTVSHCYSMSQAGVTGNVQE